MTNENFVENYKLFNEADKIYEIEKTSISDFIWFGKPYLLCYVLKEVYINILVVLLIFLWFDFYLFLPTILVLIWLFCTILFQIIQCKNTKYYITEKYIIVKLWNHYWGYPKENIIIRQQKMKNLPCKYQFWLKLFDIEKPRLRKNIIEIIFGVRTIQFKRKYRSRGESTTKNTQIDLYYRKGRFHSIKDYKEVMKILGI